MIIILEQAKELKILYDTKIQMDELIKQNQGL